MNLTSEAGVLMIKAEDEARSLRDKHLNTNHLLLAFFRLGGTDAYRILTRYVSEEKYRQIVRQTSVHDDSSPQFIPRTGLVEGVLKGAEALASGRPVDVNDIFLSLMDRRTGLTIQVLEKLDLDPRQLRDELRATLDPAVRSA